MSWDMMATDVEQFLEDMKMENYDLMGHSMGGKVVMKLAAFRPELVGKMVVVDIQPGDDGFSRDIELYVQYMMDIRAKGLDARQYLQDRISERQVLEFLMTNYKDGKCILDLDEIYGGMKILKQGFGKFVVNIETLFIKGSKSNYISNPQVLKEYFPNSRLEILDTGHWVHSEKPLELTNLVQQFLA